MLLVIGYSLLSAYYFTRGMDNIMMANMSQAAQSFIERVPATQHDVRNEFSGFTITRDWLQMPEEIRQAFDQPPREPNVLYKRVEGARLGPPDALNIAIHLQPDDFPLYVAMRMTHEMAPDHEVASLDAIHRLLALIAIGLAIVLLLTASLWWLWRHVSGPVNALGQWARTLDAAKLAELPPDFVYPELNEMAHLVRSSLSSAQESLAREQRFLAFASHELRTPISVVRSNLELMRKMQQCEPEESTFRQEQVLARMERASLTMKHLTETLLWLSRDQHEPLPSHELDLDKLIKEVIEELRYLLEEKCVEVTVDTERFATLLPEAPARIILGNLIRNAFLHTWEGQIAIRQEGCQVWIENEQSALARDSDTGPSHTDQGFGLGLKLTEQLADKLGWPYTNQPGPMGHRIYIELRCSAMGFVDAISRAP
ncbi:sensor histidine kinase [Billgrantia montanilacus]|uniref:sensor histidine kinase n=1 Tax=Billgrantia montanilacus TaxID=2282305 RepID=UPI0015F0AB0E|nr:HAMP domain-containing sensor histidine kinase [Halomonas montanilacus]